MLIEDNQQVQFGDHTDCPNLIAALLRVHRLGAQVFLFTCGFLIMQSAASASDDTNALGRVVAKLGHSEEKGQIAWHPDGNKIVVTDDRNQGLDLWDLSARKKIWHINKYGEITADSIGFSGDGETVVVSSVAAIAPAPNRNSASALTLISPRDGHVLRDVVDIEPAKGFSNIARHF